MESKALQQRSRFEKGLALFPPPRFLRMPAVGIDISEDMVKYLSLETDASGTVIKKYGKASLPSGIVSASAILDKAQFSAFLKKLRRSEGFEFAHVSLPEEHAYLFQTDVPEDATPEQIRTVIEFQMKENVPLSPAESVFDYEFLPSEPSPTGTRKINIAVYPSKIIADYLEVFRSAGLTPLSLEMEGEASARALVPYGEAGTVLIVDMGKTKAGISIVAAGKLVFTATLDVGGDDFTSAIQRQVGNITFEEAEALKQEKGFIKGNGVVFDALLSTMSVLRDEILRHSRYWKEHSMHDGYKGSTVERVILCGGNANVAGIPEYLSASLHIPVGRGDVWTNVRFPGAYVPVVPARESVQYVTALGLALRSVDANSLC